MGLSVRIGKAREPKCPVSRFSLRPIDDNCDEPYLNRTILAAVECIVLLCDAGLRNAVPQAHDQAWLLSYSVYRRLIQPRNATRLSEGV